MWPAVSPADDSGARAKVDPHRGGEEDDMSGAASGFTLVFAEEAGDGRSNTDFIVTDGGVLLATVDHGVTWRCYGLVNTELFLLDLGFAEASRLLDANAPTRPATARRLTA